MEHPALDALLALQAPHLRAADLAVHRDDEMLEFARRMRDGNLDAALGDYFIEGLRIAEFMRAVAEWHRGGYGAVRRLLDFASGYGRATRFLVREIPAERVWSAEITGAALRFQAEHFGVHTLQSSADPERFTAPGAFDFIAVTSLFTHLPAPLFTAWLARLCALLSSDGVLFFSTHDTALLHPEPIPESGFVFEPQSESTTLDPAIYGGTWVHEDFVRSALARVAPGAAAHLVPRALSNIQDVWIVAADGTGRRPPFRFERPVAGYLDGCAPENGAIRLRGWCALPRDSARITAVRLRLGDRVVESAPSEPRPDVAALLGAVHLNAGWSFREPLPATALEETPLIVDATTSTGRTTVLFAATVATALALGARAGRQPLVSSP